MILPLFFDTVHNCHIFQIIYVWYTFSIPKFKLDSFSTVIKQLINVTQFCLMYGFAVYWVVVFFKQELMNYAKTYCIGILAWLLSSTSMWNGHLFLTMLSINQHTIVLLPYGPKKYLKGRVQLRSDLRKHLWTHFTSWVWEQHCDLFWVTFCACMSSCKLEPNLHFYYCKILLSGCSLCLFPKSDKSSKFEF